MSDDLDCKNNLAFDPTSADDLNEQGRQSEVLVVAIEKCEKLEKENQQLKDLLWSCQAYFNNQLNDNWAKSIVMDINKAMGEKK